MRRFIVLLCAFRLLASAQSGLPMVPPDAGVVFGIEWRKMVDSAAGAAFVEQIQKSDMAKFPGFQSIQSAILRDLDSVLIAAPAGGFGKGAAQPPALVIVKGRFEVASLRKMILGKQTVESYRGVELIVQPDTASSKGSRIAFLDGNTILAGDRAEVRAAIDRVKTGHLTQSRGGALAGVAELAAGNDIWMAFALPPGAMKDAPPPMGQMLADVRSAEIGMSFQEGLAFRMNVRTKDDDSARMVAQAIQGLVGMAALSQPQSPQSLEVLKKLKIAADGSQVGLLLTLDRSELDKMMKEAQARPTVASAPTRAPEPDGPKTIRITGLDSGPVVVPYDGARK